MKNYSNKFRGKNNKEFKKNSDFGSFQKTQIVQKKMIDF